LGDPSYKKRTKEWAGIEGFTITDAVGINDSGKILCNSSIAGGAPRAVILRPN